MPSSFPKVSRQRISGEAIAVVLGALAFCSACWFAVYYAITTAAKWAEVWR